jgi:carbonic anhydrase
VRWLVVTEPIQLSRAQIDALETIVKDNNRPVQPLKGRDVLIERTPVQ